MGYKLVCIDMDGTLLNSKHKVTEASKKALKRAHDMGVHIVVSTGRVYPDAEAYSNLIGVKSPIIASNGAIIKEKDSGKVIYSSFINKELALKLLNIFEEHKVKPIFSTAKEIYCGDMKFYLFLIYAKIVGIVNKTTTVKYVHSRRQWDELLREENDFIIKCEIMSKDTIKLKKVRDQLEAIKQLQIVSSMSHNIEITNKGVSKGRAVEVLAEYYNINQEEVLVIGDSENDLSMIEYAGMGIAMGNASEMVKKKANYITETNDNDGVAKAINKFIIGSKEPKVEL